MEKRNKIALMINIPLWTYVIWGIIFDGYPSILFTAPLILLLYFGTIHAKKNYQPIYWLKLGLILSLMNTGSLIYLYGSPTIWGQQFYRNTHIGTLITPQDPYVQELKNKFLEWTDSNPSINGSNWTKYATYYDDGLIKNRIYYYSYKQFENISWNHLDEIEKSMIVDWYVRRFIVNWTEDYKVYGIDEYKATPHEILQQMVNNNWTEPAKDDCDGQAAVTVSLLRALNINAYIGDGKGHWYTVVVPSQDLMEQYYLTNPILLNFWQTVQFWSYFDDDEFHLGQNWMFTAAEIFSMESEEDTFGDFYNFIDIIGSWIYILALFVVWLIVMFLNYPREFSEKELQLRKNRNEKIINKYPKLRNKKNPIRWIIWGLYIRSGNPFRKEYWRMWINTIIGFIFAAIGIWYFISHQGMLTQYSYLYLMLYSWISIVVIDRDWIIKGLIKGKNIRNIIGKKPENRKERDSNKNKNEN